MKINESSILLHQAEQTLCNFQQQRVWIVSDLRAQLTIVYSVRNSITPVSNAVRDIGHAITVLAYILLIILPFKAFI